MWKRCGNGVTPFTKAQALKALALKNIIILLLNAEAVILSFTLFMFYVFEIPHRADTAFDTFADNDTALTPLLLLFPCSNGQNRPFTAPCVPTRIHHPVYTLPVHSWVHPHVPATRVHGSAVTGVNDAPAMLLPLILIFHERTRECTA